MTNVYRYLNIDLPNNFIISSNQHTPSKFSWQAKSVSVYKKDDLATFFITSDVRQMLWYSRLPDGTKKEKDFSWYKGHKAIARSVYFSEKFCFVFSKPLYFS